MPTDWMANTHDDTHDDTDDDTDADTTDATVRSAIRPAAKAKRKKPQCDYYLPETRVSALHRHAQQYHTGRASCVGHIANRDTESGRCVECMKEVPHRRPRSKLGDQEGLGRQDRYARLPAEQTAERILMLPLLRSYSNTQHATQGNP